MNRSRKYRSSADHLIQSQEAELMTATRVTDTAFKRALKTAQARR
jgi:hypothetical protein